MIFNLSAGDNTSEEVEVLLIEFMNEVNNTLTSFKSEINTMLTGFTNDVDSDMVSLSNDIATVKSSISTMNTTVGNLGGAVKSVQRGVAKTNGSGLTININTVNPNKCLVVLNASTSNSYLPMLRSITSNTLTVSEVGNFSSGEFYSYDFSWQVIEFY